MSCRIQYSRTCAFLASQQEDSSNDGANTAGQRQQGRQHVCFGGRHRVEYCRKELRNQRVHLIVPGKKEAGPVTIVAKYHHDAIPAAAWLLQQLDLTLNQDNNNEAQHDVPVSTTRQNADVTEEEGCNDTDEIRNIDSSVTGRIILNIKKNDNAIHGTFIWQPSASDHSVRPLVPHWFFRSTTGGSNERDWCILACALIKYENDGRTRLQQNIRRRRRGMCHVFQSTGQCSYGDQCQFSHEESSRVYGTGYANFTALARNNENDDNPHSSSSTTPRGATDDVVQATNEIEEDGTSGDGGGEIEESLLVLHTCVDNLTFRLGTSVVGQLDIFMDSQCQTAFATGNSQCLSDLSQEIESVHLS